MNKNKFKSTSMAGEDDLLEVVSGNTVQTFQFKPDITLPKDTFIGFFGTKELKNMLYLSAGLNESNISQYLTKLIVTDLNKSLKREKISKTVAVQKQKEFAKRMTKKSGPQKKK